MPATLTSPGADAGDVVAVTASTLQDDRNVMAEIEPRPGALVPVLVGAGVLVAVLAGLLVGFRATGLLLAAVLGGCAVARLLLPLRVVGALAVRSRGTDVVTLTVLAVAVAVLALTAPDT
jgi:hypothetical protein